MKTHALAVITAAVALSFATPAAAQFKKQANDLVFEAPDGRVYETTIAYATKPGGLKLEKLNVDERSQGARPVSSQRTIDWIRGIVPKTFGGKECDMSYLTFHIRATAGKQLGELTGTHGKCKQKVALQGTIIPCPDRAGFKTIVWAGDPTPTACPVAVTPGAKKSQVTIKN